MNAIEQYYESIKPIVEDVNKVYSECEMLLSEQEAFNIIQLINMTSKLEGDIAEVGVYQGGSARLISKYKHLDKELYLFDTFTGLPYKSNDSGDPHVISEFKYPFENIKKYFEYRGDVNIYQGIFPQDTGKFIKDEKFSFVHLDVDVYQSTYDSLEFFYPRMVNGGIILSHDYINLMDVRNAFHDFVKDKKCDIFPLCMSNFNHGLIGSQCMIVKV